jgi:hypothetical protein
MFLETARCEDSADVSGLEKRLILSLIYPADTVGEPYRGEDVDTLGDLSGRRTTVVY